MAQFLFYNKAKDALHDFQTLGDYKWMLMKSGSFNADDDFVSTIVAGETTVPAYARIAVDTPTRTVNDSSDNIEYAVGANPDFGNLSVSPENIIGLVLIKVVTNDADSIPICWGSFTSISSSAVNPFVPQISGLLVADLS